MPETNMDTLAVPPSLLIDAFASMTSAYLRKNAVSLDRIGAVCETVETSLLSFSKRMSNGVTIEHEPAPSPVAMPERAQAPAQTQPRPAAVEDGGEVGDTGGEGDEQTSAQAAPSAEAPPQQRPKPVPPVDIKKSVQHEYIICLEDNRRFKSLKRHLGKVFNMTPEQYREKWGLPADYPMVAPSYSATRSQLAKQMGLGQGGATRSTKPDDAPNKTGGRKKAAAADPDAEQPEVEEPESEADAAEAAE